MKQMLENGFFHADPHAGNLLAMPSGKLCYLDFGMVRGDEWLMAYGLCIYTCWLGKWFA